MLLIKTELRASAIHGLGVFTLEPVKKGQIIWQEVEGLDVTFPEELMEGLPEAAVNYLNRYAYYDTTRPGMLCLDCDNGRFMNHTETPNTDCRGDYVTATRDIAVGEELTCNYADFEGARFDCQFKETGS